MMSNSSTSGRSRSMSCTASRDSIVVANCSYPASFKYFWTILMLMG